MFCTSALWSGHRDTKQKCWSIQWWNYSFKPVLPFLRLKHMKNDLNKFFLEHLIKIIQHMQMAPSQIDIQSNSHKSVLFEPGKFVRLIWSLTYWAMHLYLIYEIFDIGASNLCKFTLLCSIFPQFPCIFNSSLLLTLWLLPYSALFLHWLPPSCFYSYLLSFCNCWDGKAVYVKLLPMCVLL